MKKERIRKNLDNEIETWMLRSADIETKSIVCVDTFGFLYGDSYGLGDEIVPFFIV